MRKQNELKDKRSCINKALPNEMVFVLLGRDEAAPVAIQAWINERLRLGKNQATDSQILHALDIIYTMQQEREEYVGAK